MKTKSLISLAVASLMIVGCSKKEDVIEVSKTPISLSSGLSVQTRAASALQSTQFDNLSSIGVFINEKGATSAAALTYIADGAGNLVLKTGQSQPFFPTNGNNIDICGVYPSTALVSGSLVSKETFTVDADQSGDVNYKNSDLMTGNATNISRTSSAIPVTFYHRLAKISVTLVAGTDMTNAKLKDAVVTIKNTLPTVEFTPNTGALGAISGSAGDIILDGAAVADTKSSAIIVPQTVAANKAFIQIKLAAGGIYTYILDADKTFASANAYSYVITINSTGIKVSTTIADWTTGADIPGTAQ